MSRPLADALAVMISHPHDVANLIEEAARTAAVQ